MMRPYFRRHASNGPGKHLTITGRNFIHERT